MRVLVVDDNDDLRRLMSNALEFSGHEVEERPGGDEARAYLDSVDPLPHAVVLDVQMPVVDGWDTLTAIRANPRTAHIAVVMCTVKSRAEDVARGWESGCDGYLVKPFDLDGFVREVEAAASRNLEERESHRKQMLAHVEKQLTT